ncbi:MAG: hypothetical protein ACFFF4_12615 [Candidatus Thorarchaeota archaeon]
MGSRGFAVVWGLILCVLCFNVPVTAQSTSPATQEFILDAALGDSVYSMVLNDQNDLLLAGDRVPADSNESFRLEGMLLKVTNERSVSEIYVMDDNEVNSITDVAIDTSGNILISGKGGEWEGRQFGYVMKLSEQGEMIWSVEFPDIYFHDYVGIELNQSTNDVFFTGTVSYGLEGIFLSKINETGDVDWEQIWYEEGYLDYPYTSRSLYITSQGLLLGADYGVSSNPAFSVAERTIAFSSNGTELWTYGEGNDLLYELGDGDFLCSYGENVTLCNPNLEPIWTHEIELHCDYSSRIYGFDINSTGSFLAYGCVIGLGQSPVKGTFSLSYTPAPIPQTLLVSISEEGEVEWYDFYVSGDWSVPCGASFDHEGKLVVAGHSISSSAVSEESNIWILWDFMPTPFPDVIICEETQSSIIFGLALVPFAIILSWGLYRARKGHLTEDPILAKAINIFRKGGFFFLVVFFLAGGVYTSPVPSPIYLLPLYGLGISLLFIVTSYIMEHLAKREKDEPETVNHIDEIYDISDD